MKKIIIVVFVIALTSLLFVFGQGQVVNVILDNNTQEDMVARFFLGGQDGEMVTIIITANEKSENRVPVGTVVNTFTKEMARVSQRTLETDQTINLGADVRRHWGGGQYATSP